MTPEEAIALCRKAYPIEGARWPQPLVCCLDNPPSEARVFEWLISCVGDVLDFLGTNTEDLTASLAIARRSAIENNPTELIQQRAYQLWRGRVGDPARTAVAQLLFALVAHRERKPFYRSSCTVPLVILDRLASDRGGLLERVVADFSEHAGRIPVA